METMEYTTSEYKIYKEHFNAKKLDNNNTNGMESFNFHLRYLFQRFTSEESPNNFADFKRLLNILIFLVFA